MLSSLGSAVARRALPLTRLVLASSARGPTGIAVVASAASATSSRRLLPAVSVPVRLASRYKGDLDLVRWEVPDVSREPQKDKVTKDARSFTNRAWRQAGRHKEARAASLLHGVMPEVVPTFLPIINLLVEYPASLVHRGNWFQPAEVAQAPAVTFKAEKGSLWTLLMVTPDMPAREAPSYDAFVHWAVCNIKGDDITQVSSGETVVPYLQPAPARNGGAGRYVFVLALQEGPVQLSVALADRASHAVESLLSEHKLSPKGIAFFQATHDDTVDAVYESLQQPVPFVPTPQELKQEQAREEKELRTRLKYELLKL